MAQNNAINAIEQNNVYYVSKVGNDNNAGRTPHNAFLTFGTAIAAVNAQTPSTTNRFSIVCLDGGRYTENFTIPSWTSLVAPGASFIGALLLSDDSAFLASSAERSAASGFCIGKSAGTGRAYANINRIVVGSGAIGIGCSSGELGFNVDNIEVENGYGCGAAPGGGRIDGEVDSIVVTGTGTAVGQLSGGSVININCNKIIDSGSGRAIQISSGILNVHAQEINCNAAYAATGGTLNIVCSQLSGTTIATSVVNILNTSGDSSLFGNLRIGNDNLRLLSWSSVNFPDIDSLLPGSPFGSLIQGDESGHLVLGLRDNDPNDSFAVVTGNGNYVTDETYDNAAFFVNAVGRAGFGTTAFSVDAKVQITSTDSGLKLTPMTAAQASAITASDGLMLYVNTTDATFTSVGFWGYENGAWVKL